MYVVIPTGSRITATIVGRAVRNVTCEKCGGEYVYLVVATGSGSGTNPLYLDGEGASARAHARARFELQQNLAGSFLPVPCPKCGWYQTHMVRILQRQRFIRWLFVAAIPLVLLAFGWALTSSEDPVDLHAGFFIGLSIALVATSILFHFIRDDNADAAARLAKDPTSGGVAMHKVDFDKLVEAESSAAASPSGQV